jgi:hypothetical protein
MKKWFDAYTFSGTDRDEKGRFANVFAHLIAELNSRRDIPDWFLKRLQNLFGFSYVDSELFYDEHFSSLTIKIQYINEIFSYIPRDGAWVDVERTLRQWMVEENIHQKLCEKIESLELFAFAERMREE